MNQSERRTYLIRYLLREEQQGSVVRVPRDVRQQWLLLRGLMNVREPADAGEDFLRIQDAFLLEETRQKGVTDLQALEPVRDGLYLWQGDITTLRCDAIVNAANSGLTGCYVPNHRCIDNCIHTYAGIQLRLECAQIMQAQGYPEPAGRAKLTRAYNLPCRYILHTVGPVITGPLTGEDCALLASCYRSCLELAAEHRLESVAFCCISTGEFHFPAEKAAEIAVQTVTDFLRTPTSVSQVVFNVFQDTDREIYARLLQQLPERETV